MNAVVIKKYKPYTPSRRHMVSICYPDLHKGTPLKSLVERKNNRAGRNNKGRITTRHQGGGARQHYRLVDFKRVKHDGIVGVVERLEYDPNRTAHIALIKYKNGAWSYIIAPENLKPGDEVMSGDKAEIKVGNCMSLAKIPVGSLIHCIETKMKKGSQLVRSAGGSATLIGKEQTSCLVRLKNGTVLRIPLTCRATIGVISNSKHNLRSLGKAGAKRWRNIRPTVRGVAMNPVDHPHGGGEGRTSGGGHPRTPWGVPTKGYVTRRRKVSTMIVKRRKRKHD